MYALFMFLQAYPEGGMNDYKGTFVTIEMAQAAAARDPDYGIAQIALIDTTGLSLVAVACADWSDPPIYTWTDPPTPTDSMD